MPISRRTVITSAAALAAGASLPAVALARVASCPALLAEHRRSSAQVLALEALHKQAKDVTLEILNTNLAEVTADEAFALYEALDQRRVRERQQVEVAVANIDRQIWATPASTYDDIVARAEIAAFWNRGWEYYDHHGYDDPFCERRLVDCVLLDQPTRPSELTFEPPVPLLERRNLSSEWCSTYGPHVTDDDAYAHFEACFHIEQA